MGGIQLAWHMQQQRAFVNMIMNLRAVSLYSFLANDTASLDNWLSTF